MRYPLHFSTSVFKILCNHLFITKRWSFKVKWSCFAKMWIRVERHRGNPYIQTLKTWFWLYDKQGDLVSFAEAYPVLAREGRGDMFWPQYLKNQKSLLYNLPQISFWATCISEIFDFGPIEDLLLHNVFLILFLCYCLHKVTFCIHFWKKRKKFDFFFQ